MTYFRIRRIGDTDDFTIDRKLEGWKLQTGNEKYSFEEALYYAEKYANRERYARLSDGIKIKVDVRTTLQLNANEEYPLCCGTCTHCTRKSKYVQLCDYNGVIKDISEFCRAYEPIKELK